MRTLRICFVLTLIWLGLAAPRRAHAQDTGDQAAAQALFDEGMRLFGDGEYGESCEKFEASLALVPAMGTRGKLAECYEKVGRTASAWAAYREVAVLAKRAGQTVREQVANERAARLEADLSYLTINVSSEAQVPGLRIARNGVVLSHGAYGTAIATDPGPQSIDVSAEGYRSQTVTATLADGARSEVEIPVLEALPAATPAPPLASNVATPSTSKPNNTMRIAGISTAAVGGGALVLAAVLSLKAKGDYDSAFDDGLCESDNTCTPAGVTAVDDARSLANLGTIFAISGTALLGAGAYLWLRSPNESSTPGSAVRVAPSAGSDNLGLTLSGKF